MLENAMTDTDVGSGPSTAAASPSTTCVVVGRPVTVTKIGESRWTVEVDAHALDGTFSSAGDAWLAGVREADRLRAAAE